jgi:prevent-host-death family protein
MRTMTLAETKSHQSAVIDQVQAGEEVVITHRGRPVARIVADSGRIERDSATLAQELRAFVLAQPVAEDNSVVAIREMDRF